MAHFLHTVLDRIFPEAVWGSAANKKLVHANILRLVSLSRFERISVAQLLEGFRYVFFWGGGVL